MNAIPTTPPGRGPRVVGEASMDNVNGMNIPDHGGRSVFENAARAARDVIERAIRHDGVRAANPEWDVRTEVYAKGHGRVERYLIAGGGPTEYLYFVFDEDGDLDHAYLRYSSTGDIAIVPFGPFDAEDLYKQVEGYRD